ncbi:helix-turn-helix transcriptional regulator [Gloeobacter violaceus]|uniref:helix-turn-helix transcriptional regulator n=1 Tax=Gloeobacter violaceus TaxID=33072 RepID=UPI001E533132|nr:LuxR C-terminal-related transcriptional regulator [Gloeobacter violaceus]
MRNSRIAPVASKALLLFFTGQPLELTGLRHSDGHDFRSTTTVRLNIPRQLPQTAAPGEIAQALHLTEGTVKNHVTRILAQLGLRDRTQLALWTYKHLG